MRIGISARGLSVGVGGVRTTLEQLVPRLVRQDGGNHYVVFHNSPEHRHAFPGAEEVCFSAPTAFLWENAWLPAVLRRHRQDLLFCPKNFVPLGVPRDIRTVVMVYDLVYFPLRGRYLSEYPLLDVAYMRAFFPASARRADRIITISENTRRDLLDLLPLDPAKVTAVHLGVTPPAPAALTGERLDAVKQRYRLDGPYVFYCGTLSPRKNIARLVEAFARIKDRVPHRLVVTAGKSWRDRATYDAVERWGLADRFRRLGDVPASDMPALYRMADAFAYVSLYEGFGLPVLEAMACGCPVLASNTSSLPEVTGEAALTVDPEDVEAIADGLLRILSDGALAAGLRARGGAQAALFTWEATARRVAELFRQLA